LTITCLLAAVALSSKSAVAQTRPVAPNQPGQQALPATAAAPATPQASATKKLTFDAASVRPSSLINAAIGGDFLDPASEQAPPKGGLFSWNVPITFLVNFAYDLRPRVKRNGDWDGLPKPVQGWYTIVARAEGNPTRDDVRQMVRSLLEDRFQIVAHIENSDGQVYALVVDKPGLGLKPHPEGAPCELPPSQADDKRYPHAYPSYKAVPVQCGVFFRGLSHSWDNRLEMLDVTMLKIADTLSSFLPLTVVDRTGLAGRYDAMVDWGSNQVSPNTSSSSPSDEIGLPQLLSTALEKQLGLKLVKQTGSVSSFVIDHAGTLSEN
jgi:uncharacterized protein (TIGR03435 family)